MKNHEQRPGKGVLFVNDKRKTDSQPHLKGGFMADRDIKAGEWVKLAGWRQYRDWERVEMACQMRLRC